MLKFLTKQFIYGRIFLWVKERLSGILFLVISIFIIIYFHNEYLKYLEYKDKVEGNYIGISFIIKNILILLVAITYYYFFFVLQKNKNKTSEIKQGNEISSNDKEMVNTLEEFLEDDELQK